MNLKAWEATERNWQYRKDTGSPGSRGLRRAFLQVHPRGLVYQGIRATKDRTEETVQPNQKSRGRGAGSGQENEEITESYYIVGIDSTCINFQPDKYLQAKTKKQKI